MRSKLYFFLLSLLVVQVTSKTGVTLWGCPQRNLTSVPWESSLGITKPHYLAYIDNFLNWIMNTARIVFPYDDFTCRKIGNWGYSSDFYNSMILTGKLSTKLIYYDEATGTKAFYGCIDYDGGS